MITINTWALSALIGIQLSSQYIYKYLLKYFTTFPPSIFHSSSFISITLTQYHTAPVYT